MKNPSLKSCSEKQECSFHRSWSGSYVSCGNSPTRNQLCDITEQTADWWWVPRSTRVSPCTQRWRVYLPATLSTVTTVCFIQQTLQSSSRVNTVGRWILLFNISFVLNFLFILFVYQRQIQYIHNNIIKIITKSKSINYEMTGITTTWA